MSQADIQLHEFLLDTHSNIDRLDRCAAQLDGDPADADGLLEAMRLTHAASGTAARMGMSRLWGVLSQAEGYLIRARAAETGADSRLIWDVVEAARAILARVELEGTEGDEDFASLRRRLSASGKGGVPRKNAAV